MIIDGHCDTVVKAILNSDDIFEINQKYHIDIPRFLESLVKVQTFGFFTEPKYEHLNATHHALKNISIFKQNLEKSNKNIKIIKTSEDLNKIIDGENKAIILSLENASPIVGDLDILYTFFDIGIRMIGLTWNNRNEIADGLYVSDNPSGLTKFGISAVKKMEELGIVIDVAHLEEKGFWDVIQVAKKPFVVSHGNARALAKTFEMFDGDKKILEETKRNLTDEQLRALAEIKGLIGVTFVPDFLTNDGNATINDVVNHIKYIANLIGIDYVALGSDFDGIDKTPIGLENIMMFPNLITLLEKEGFSKEDIEKITYKNWQRVFNICLPQKL